MVQDTKALQKNFEPPLPVANMVEDIVGCKWSLAVLAAVRQGIARPGVMQRHIEGISTKVLNERLAKMQRFRILEKAIFPEVPPRVEYRLTAFGMQFLAILDQIESLQKEIDRGAVGSGRDGR